MMRALTLAELQAPLAGRLYGRDRSVSQVSTDSRSIGEGDLFVALSGENFDGHQYLGDVAAAGAAAALVSRRTEVELSLLLVDDTEQALGRLGAFNRQQYTGPLVAITGSSGKTTVKNMVNAVLSRRGNTLATQGNFNNEIGVPLTLLRLAPDTDYAVVEMGAARSGDIAWLCELGAPTVALLLNAMPAHLEGFGTVDDVAAAKGEIFDDLGPAGVAIINADQIWADDWRARAGAATVLDFGLEKPAQISAVDIQPLGLEGTRFTARTPSGEVSITLPLPGRHNVANALAAIAVGLACGLSLPEIGSGLESVRPEPGRLVVAAGVRGCTVIDDCYNANPGSVRAAIDMLAACAGRRTLLLGAMKELGENSQLLHREIGEYARGAGIEQLWGVGPELHESVEAFGRGGRFFADRDSLLASLGGAFDATDTVLVKGSRSAGMEHALRVVLADSQVEGG